MTAAVARLDQTLADVDRDPPRCASRRAGRGRQLRHRVRARRRRGGLCPRVAAGAAGADQVAHRRPHRRRPAARRGQLHRPDDQPHRAAARPRATAVRPCCRGDGTAGRRPTPGRRRRSPTSARIRCATYRGPNGWCSSATPTCTTSSRRCGQSNPVAAQHLPVQLTRFIGRKAEMQRHPRGARRQPARHADRRGRRGQDAAGGRGRRRASPDEFADGVWYVDLAPITDPEVVPVTVARALGLPDQPGRRRWTSCCGSSAIAGC